jgi:hypothetical protein
MVLLGATLFNFEVDFKVFVATIAVVEAIILNKL